VVSGRGDSGMQKPFCRRKILKNEEDIPKSDSLKRMRGGELYHGEREEGFTEKTS